MTFSSTNFDTCTASWVIYNNSFLMICWTVPWCSTLPTVGNLKSLYIYSLKCKNLEVEFNISSWIVLSVLKIFKNFTVKHPRQSLFLIIFIKNRVQHRFLWLKFSKFLWTPFYRTPLVAASVRTLSIWEFWCSY